MVIRWDPIWLLSMLTLGQWIASFPRNPGTHLPSHNLHPLHCIDFVSRMKQGWKAMRGWSFHGDGLIHTPTPSAHPVLPSMGLQQHLLRALTTSIHAALEASMLQGFLNTPHNQLFTHKSLSSTGRPWLAISAKVPAQRWFRTQWISSEKAITSPVLLSKWFVCKVAMMEKGFLFSPSMTNDTKSGDRVPEYCNSTRLKVSYISNHAVQPLEPKCVSQVKTRDLTRNSPK